MHLTLCDIFQEDSASRFAPSVIYFLGVDIDSVQSAIAKLNLHVALSSLQNNSKTEFNEFQFHPDFRSHFLLRFSLLESFNIIVSFLRKD